MYRQRDRFQRCHCDEYVAGIVLENSPPAVTAAQLSLSTLYTDSVLSVVNLAASDSNLDAIVSERVTWSITDAQGTVLNTVISEDPLVRLRWTRALLSRAIRCQRRWRSMMEATGQIPILLVRSPL